MKTCNHCGTSENLIIDKNGVVWSKCKDCHSRLTSIRMTGENHPSYGKPRSTHVKNRLSETQKGRIHTIEHRKKNSESNKGELNHNYGGKTNTPEAREKMSLSHKFTAKDFIAKYPWITLFEEIRDIPKEKQEIGKPGVQFRCKKCNEWFTPESYQVIANRINALKQDMDTHYFYCSDECKNVCPLFRMHTKPSLNNKQIGSIPGIYTWRNEVLSRQLKLDSFNHCEICNCVINLEVHHEHPVKTHPLMALDPDNGIILCDTCHYKFGHKDECSTGNLANKICI